MYCVQSMTIFICLQTCMLVCMTHNEVVEPLSVNGMIMGPEGKGPWYCDTSSWAVLDICAQNMLYTIWMAYPSMESHKCVIMHRTLLKSHWKGVKEATNAWACGDEPMEQLTGEPEQDAWYLHLALPGIQPLAVPLGSLRPYEAHAAPMSAR
jgi:hypothetical protein